MKKLFVLPLLVSFLALPFMVFASVDITLEDKSTTEQKSVSILVDTGTDTLESIGFKVTASTDVTISQVIDQNSTCEEFTYTNESNVITIACTLDTAKVINGYVGTIIFTSTGDDYTFTVSKTDGLELGTLTLGTVTNIEAEEVDTTTTPTTTTPTTTTTTSTANTITKYLPYILIGGAVILLFSVVGIIVSKKKEPKVETETMTPEQMVMETPAEEPTPTTMPTTEAPVQENTFTPTVQEPETPAAQEIPEVKEEPTIQEKLEQPIVEEPIAMPSVEMPTPNPTEAPLEQNQTSDLAALISGEQQSTTPLPTQEQPVQETPQMPEIQTTSQPLPDLQQLVNVQTAETPAPIATPEQTVQPTEEVPPVAPPTQPTI